MSVHIRTQQGSHAIGAHLPLNVALAVLPTLPRPLLARLVANAIERLDLMDGDADLEPEVTEQDDEPEVDDHGEEDDEDRGLDVGEPDFRRPTKRQRKQLTKLYGPGCTDSNDDHGGEEIGEPEDGRLAVYGIDQSKGPLSPHTH